MELPKEAQKAAKHTIEHLYGNNSRVSVVLSNLNAGEIPYVVIQEINRILDSRWDLSVTLYYCNEAYPLELPLCGMMPINYINQDYGTIVSVDPFGWHMSQICRRSRHIHFCYDPNLFLFIDEKLLQKIRESDTIIVCRSSEHRNLLEQKFNLKTNSQIIRDFNLEKLCRISDQI